MGKHKQVTCKICYKEMRSDILQRHIKVHLKYQPAIKSNEEMCRELVLEIVDESTTQEQSKTKRNPLKLVVLKS